MKQTTENYVVDDLMTTAVVSVSVDSSLTNATRLMGASHIRHLVIVDWNRVPVGIISERDLYRFMAHHLAAGGTITGGISVQRVMRESPVTVQIGYPLDEAARMMDDQKIGSLIVIDSDGRLAGILTRGDVLRFFSRMNSESVVETAPGMQLH